MTNKKFILGLFAQAFLFALFPLSAQDNPSSNQTKTLSIDLDKKTISGPLPYDEFVRLLITSKKNPVVVKDSSDLLRNAYVNNKRVPHQSRAKFRKASAKYLRFYESLETVKFDVKKINDSTYQATVPPQILPNALYELIFRKNLNLSQKNTIYEIAYLIKSGHIDSLKKAKTLYSKKILSLEAIDYRLIPYQILPEEEQMICNAQSIANFIDQYTEITPRMPELSEEEIRLIVSKFKEAKINPKNFVDFAFEHHNPIGNGISDVELGYRCFTKKSITPSFQYLKRLKNLKKSLMLIDSLESELRTLSILFADNEDIKNYYNNKFLKTKQVLGENKNTLQKLTKHINKQIDSLFEFSEIITVNSISTQDKDGGLTYLQSDVGFINTVVPTPQGDREYLGRLYLGLNYHFGGFNKDKKIAQVANKRLAYRMSVALGVTVGEINESGYTDLFNNISPSLGINYRVTNDVRFGLGFLVLRNERNPVIEDESPAIRPYASVSFNLKLLKDLAIFSRIFESQQ